MKRGMSENEIGKHVVDCAVKLHIAAGPGLLERVSESLLSHELRSAGLHLE